MTWGEGVHGWLLARRPQGNTSLVVDVFTLEGGRQALLARGGRKNPLLQPFAPLWLTAGGRGNLPTLRQVEAAASPLLLTGERLWCAYYINELVLRMLPVGESVPLLFACYGTTLDALVTSKDAQPALRHFEQQLLTACGYALSLAQDVQGVELAPDAHYQLTYDGLQRAASGFVGSVLIGFAQGQWSLEIARTSRDLLRTALAYHLGAAPLKSRELLLSLRKQESSV